MTSPSSFLAKDRTSKTDRGGLAPSSQTVGSPWVEKAARKMDLAKSGINESCVDLQLNTITLIWTDHDTLNLERGLGRAIQILIKVLTLVI